MQENLEKRSKFLLVGLVVSVEFQRARLYIERLYTSCPKFYEEPDIRPLLNLDWCLYLTKIRRRFGGKIWALKKNAVVFLNGEYMGDDCDLFQYVLGQARIRVAADFHMLGCKQLKSILKKNIENGKKYAYFSISIGGVNVGSMLFMLYEELVPKTTEIFLKRCKSTRNGWRNRPIHRIVKNCWIQGGGFDLKDRHLPCENYVIPHDRRGVLSMCNSCKHTDNSIQFIISLDATPWMDYKYVAFGQLVQGEEILRKIEAVNTRYQAPKIDIIVTYCEEYTLEAEIDPKCIDEVTKYYDNIDILDGLPEDVEHPDDVDSILSESKYRKGDYCLDSDLRNNTDTMRLPDYLVKLYKEYTGADMGEEGTDVYEDHQCVLQQPVPITQSAKYQSTLEMNQSIFIQDIDLDIVDALDTTEVVQKVIEFDSIPPMIEPAKLSSSQEIDEEEVKAMFV